MLVGRPQVLANGENVDARRTQVTHGGEQLVPVLAQPADDSGLGEQLGIHVLGAIQQLERTRIAATGSRDAIQPRDRLEIVIQDVGFGINDEAQRCGIAFEVGDEDLDRGLGQSKSNLCDAVGKDFRAAVRQIVAIDAGDDDVPEAHLRHRIREPPGLTGIERSGRPVRDGAVRAVARADIPQDHECRRLVLPAFPDVGAVRFLADGVELEAAHHLLQGEVVGTARSLDLEPGGFALVPLGGPVSAWGELNERGGHAELKIAATRGAG